jgi:hypothetical protein
MTNAASPIIDRIRKLLELSRSTNEHEAANAAARAAELMRKYEIDQAVLAATAPGETPPEEIITDGIGGKEGKSTSWRVLIGQGVAAATGCKQWSAGGRMEAMGTRSAVGTWNYLCQYLTREVDRLADAGWNAYPTTIDRISGVRRWKNAFRVGAAQVIRTRLIEQARSQAASKKADVNAAAAAVINPATGLPASATQALAIIDHDAARVAAEYEAMAKRERFVTRKIGQVSSAGGYAAGREAGGTVNLGAGSGRGLPAPAKAIKANS